MEIIDELEPEKRGVYGGGVGYFSAGGDMDMCIALRTAVVKDEKLYIQAGGGVVYDSDPEAEYPGDGAQIERDPPRGGGCGAVFRIREPLMAGRAGFDFGSESIAPGTRKRVTLPTSILPDHTPVGLEIEVLNGKRKGPTVFVSAGVHGDEVIGVEILRRLLRMTQPRPPARHAAGHPDREQLRLPDAVALPAGPSRPQPLLSWHVAGLARVAAGGPIPE